MTGDSGDEKAKHQREMPEAAFRRSDAFKEFRALKREIRKNGVDSTALPSRVGRGVAIAVSSTLPFVCMVIIERFRLLPVSGWTFWMSMTSLGLAIAGWAMGAAHILGSRVLGVLAVGGLLAVHMSVNGGGGHPQAGILWFLVPYMVVFVGVAFGVLSLFVKTK